jgi:hypothetical protein
LACFELNYALNQNFLLDPHFVLLAAREEGTHDIKCPSNVVFDYATGGIAQMHVENMSSAAKHSLGSYPLRFILEAQGKTESFDEKGSEFNLEKIRLCIMQNMYGGFLDLLRLQSWQSSYLKVCTVTQTSQPWPQNTKVEQDTYVPRPMVHKN